MEFFIKKVICNQEYIHMGHYFKWRTCRDIFSPRLLMPHPSIQCWGMELVEIYLVLVYWCLIRRSIAGVWNLSRYI